MAGLDVLRFLAASVVIISHAHLFGGAGNFVELPGFAGRILGEISVRGGPAVDVFFVLSGFLVSGLLFREAAQAGTVDVSRFLIRRGFKIYPAFWVMLAASLVWIYWTGHSVSLKAVLSELFYVQNYGSGVCGITWSLAVEEHFYFLLAGMFWFYQRRAGPGRVLQFGWVPDLFLTVAVICLVLRAVTWAVIFSNNGDKSYWFRFVDHAVIDSMFFGLLLSHLWHNCWNDQTRRRVRAWSVPLALAGLFLLSTQFELLMPAYVFRIFGHVFIFLGAGGIVLSSLSIDFYRCPAPVRWLAWLGRYSYSVYLWHMLAGNWLAPWLHWKISGPGGCLVNLGLYLVGAWTFGLAMGRLVEFPMLKLRDRWFPSRL